MHLEKFSSQTQIETTVTSDFEKIDF